MINQNAFLASLNFRGPTQKIDASFRLWLNCGTVNITVAGAGSGGTNMACSISPQQNTFSFSNTKKMYRAFVTNDYPPVAQGVGEGMGGGVGEGWFH